MGARRRVLAVAGAPAVLARAGADGRAGRGRPGHLGADGPAGDGRSALLAARHRQRPARCSTASTRRGRTSRRRGATSSGTWGSSRCCCSPRPRCCWCAIARRPRCRCWARSRSRSACSCCSCRSGMASSERYLLVPVCALAILAAMAVDGGGRRTPRRVVARRVPRGDPLPAGRRPHGRLRHGRERRRRSRTRDTRAPARSSACRVCRRRCCDAARRSRCRPGRCGTGSRSTRARAGVVRQRRRRAYPPRPLRRARQPRRGEDGAHARRASTTTPRSASRPGCGRAAQRGLGALRRRRLPPARAGLR